MRNKKGLWTLFLSMALIFLLVLLGYLIFHYYFQESSDGGAPAESVFAGEPDNCVGMEDAYVLPDFQKLRNVLSNEQMVEDVPKRGKIRLGFYHFVGDCRKWDKIYLLQAGKIEEENILPDIDLWIDSNYADLMVSKNICEVIHEAREKGDLGQSVNIGQTKLMWTYKSMLKYKECLGL